MKDSFYRELNFKHSNENRQSELIHQYILFRVFLPIREATVDSPVITSVAPTVQLLQSDQSHVIWGQTWNTVLGGWAQVDPVEATTTDVRNSLVAVGFSVPCVPAVLLLAETLPYVTDARRKTHLGHLLRSPHRHQCDIERLLYFTAKNMILTLYWKKCFKVAHNLIIKCLINVSLQCPLGLCHLQTGQWRLLAHLSCAAWPGAAVSSSPLHVLYSSPGGMSSNTASDLWSPPNSDIEAEELHLQWDLMGKLVGIF